MNFLFGIILLAAVVLATNEDTQKNSVELNSRIRRSASLLENSRAAVPNNNAKAGRASSTVNPRASTRGPNINSRAANQTGNANPSVNNEARNMMLRALNATRISGRNVQTNRTQTAQRNTQRPQNQNTARPANRSG